MTLYEYTKEIDDIIARHTDEDGVIDDSILEELDKLELEKNEKVDNCIKFFKSRKAMAEALKNEKTAIARRQQIAENEAEQMKQYLQYCLEGSKWESVAGKVSYRTSKAVEIDDIDAIPEEFKRYKVEADKTLLKDALQKGIITGAHMVERVSAVIK